MFKPVTVAAILAATSIGVSGCGNTPAPAEKAAARTLGSCPIGWPRGVVNETLQNARFGGSLFGITVGDVQRVLIRDGEQRCFWLSDDHSTIRVPHDSIRMVARSGDAGNRYIIVATRTTDNSGTIFVLGKK